MPASSPDPASISSAPAPGFGLYIHYMEPGEKETKGLSLATEPGAHCNMRNCSITPGKQ